MIPLKSEAVKLSEDSLGSTTIKQHWAISMSIATVRSELLCECTAAESPRVGSVPAKRGRWLRKLLGAVQLI